MNLGKLYVPRSEINARDIRATQRVLAEIDPLPTPDVQNVELGGAVIVKRFSHPGRVLVSSLEQLRNARGLRPTRIRRPLLDCPQLPIDTHLLPPWKPGRNRFEVPKRSAPPKYSRKDDRDRHRSEDEVGECGWQIEPSVIADEKVGHDRCECHGR